jgi:DNA invertase Pin-like site-specific DNA recombinase
MRLVAYLRVSTDLQAEQGLGLDVQRRGIRAWAKAHGHRIVRFHSDEGISGSNGVETRQGLLDALNDLEAGDAAGLVMYRLDRLARKLTVQEATLARVWSMGCTAYSVDLGEIPQDDPDDPMRTALRQMVGVFSQLERGMIAARLRSGRRLKAERGGYAGGAPKYGYRASEGDLVPDEREAATVARILQMHADGTGSRGIAAALNADGVPAKRGGSWSSAQVCRVIRDGAAHSTASAERAL